MNTSNRIKGDTPPSHWLDIAETLAVVSTIGGAIAATVSQQIAMAAIPLPLAATLSFANRRRQMGALIEHQHLEVSQSINHSNDTLQTKLSETQQTSDNLQSQVDHLLEQDTQTLKTLETLTSQTKKLGEEIDRLNQFQVQSQSTLTSLSEQQKSTAALSNELSSQISDFDNAISLLKSSTSDLSNQVETQHNHSLSLAYQTENVEELVEILREIDAITQTISAQPNVAESFYQRGLVRKRLQREEDQQIALDDFSKAIQLEPTHVGAYLERGLLESELGYKQRAVDSLHTAAKLYFENGQLEQYERARELSQNIHDLITQSSSAPEETELYLVEHLFS
ncbi:hypothetical protein [Acaryochloris marina]|uniref:hypothetical protein n=1 Tax=Acaryochloris marina TaxID=155978 RepID=UPI0021C46DD0|nr:hypothetical protein [Acaryochloris marina]BDM83335.1 hypothetical protein AM10699_61960 [Acaryochloris marina MBIC10699]